MSAPDLTLAVLRRQLDVLRLTNANIHNLAKSIFKPNMTVQWKANGRDYYGVVIEVIGTPGRTQVRVENVATHKKRDLLVAYITGLVQEH